MYEWFITFSICFERYYKKIIRTRRRLYNLVLIAIALGIVCGNMYGVNPGFNDVMVYFLLFNTFFGSIAASTTLSTFAAESDDFFRHECAAGVDPVAECSARLILDMVPLGLLAVTFTLPSSVSALAITPIWEWLCLGWAMSPIGYICTIAERQRQHAHVWHHLSHLHLYDGLLWSATVQALSNPRSA